VFHYVCEILDVNIEYDLKLMNEWLKLQRYSDSDWDETLTSKKSTSEYVFQLINESVFWSLKCQKIIVLFFCKTEYIILTETTKKAVWMQKLLKELNLRNLIWW
jgi:hypothetical protein